MFVVPAGRSQGERSMRALKARPAHLGRTACCPLLFRQVEQSGEFHRTQAEPLAVILHRMYRAPGVPTTFFIDPALRVAAWALEGSARMTCGGPSNRRWDSRRTTDSPGYPAEAFSIATGERGSMASPW